MEIIVAKNAGFCFGVQNAVNTAEKLAKDTHINKTKNKIYTYGPIIHNEQVVERLKQKNIDVITDIDKIEENDYIIIRSHGISKQEQEAIAKKGANIIDATCPNVKCIHKIVEEKLKLGYEIIIVGDANHPEIIGINGWCNNKAIIINNLDEIEQHNINNLKKVCIVSQTTYNQEKWYEIVSSIIRCAKEVLIFNTICNATEKRQNDTIELSKNVDIMIVIGGTQSSNTKKLYEISKKYCNKTLFIETSDELNLIDIKTSTKIGITAGASTPDYVIQDVIDKISK